LGVWFVVFGVGVLGPTPKPPIPNPQSPIPKKNKTKKKIFFIKSESLITSKFNNK